MPDLLSMLRLANIFSPTGQQTNQQFPVGSIGGPSVSPMQQQGGNEPDLMQMIQGLLSPRDEQFNNFQQMISSMPQRSQYEPNKLRKISAAIAGMGTGGPVGIANGQVVGYRSNIPEGLKVQQAINEEPYSRALTDWSNKIDPIAKATTLEQQRNVGDRQTAIGALQRKTARDTLDERVRKDMAAEEDKDLDRAIREMRAEVYKYKAEHPNSVFKEDNEGNIIAIDPSNPKAIYVTDPSGNKIKSSKLPDADRINLQLKNELTKIGARGEESRETEGFRQANRKELESGRQINRLELKSTPGPAKPASAMTPSAQNTARVNKAIDIVSQHPELKTYFVYGGNGKPTGELTSPKDPNEPGFQMTQRLMSPNQGDIKLTPDVKSQSSSQSTKEVTGSDVKPPIKIYESDVLKQARKDLKPGYVLVTKDGGLTVMQMPSEKIKDLKPESGYVVIK